MDSKKIITARPSNPVLEEFILEACQPHFQKLLKCSADDLNSLASDLLHPDTDLSEAPLPHFDYRDAPVGYIIALSVVLGEFLNAQKGLGGDTSALVHGLRDRRKRGEQIGRWRTVADGEIQ
jgi:hypothetical protein